MAPVSSTSCEPPSIRRKIEITPPRYFDKARSCNCINEGASGEEAYKRNAEGGTISVTRTSVGPSKEISLIRWFSDNSLNQRWVQARQKVAKNYRMGLAEPKELLKYKLKTHVSMTNLAKENDRNQNYQQQQPQQQQQQCEFVVPRGWMESFQSDNTSSFNELSYSVRNRFVAEEGKDNGVLFSRKLVISF